jgi:hypothetical protein
MPGRRVAAATTRAAPAPAVHTACAPGWRPALALLAILAATALLRVRLLGVPLERDEGEYAYMGQLILAGEVPYLAAHNMKLPGVYYAYAAILGLFGETDVAIRVGLVLVNAAAIALVYLVGRRLLDTSGGLCAAAAYAVLSLGHAVSGFAANAEHFVVVPALAGILLLAPVERAPTPGRIAGAALLLGIGVLMKQQAAAFVAFGGLWVLARAGSWRRRAGDGLLFATAAVLPFALVCLGMHLAGAFGPFWFWTVTYAREYVSMIPLEAGLAQLGGELGRVTGAAMGLWLLAALGAVAPWRDREARPRAWFLAGFTLASVAAVSAGLRFSHHYFILLLPAASLLVAVAVGTLARTVPARAEAIRVGVPVLAVLLALAQERAYLLHLSPTGVARAVYGANPFPEAVEIGRWLRAHSDPGDRVAVVGSEPQIYFYARRRAATSYMYTYPMMEPQPFSRRMQEEMIAQIERERPRFLVLVNVDASWSRRPDSSTLVFEWAETKANGEYRAVGLADIRSGGETVYHWGDAAGTAQPQSRFHVTTFERRT